LNAQNETTTIAIEITVDATIATEIIAETTENLEKTEKTINVFFKNRDLRAHQNFDGLFV
jgi:hypothetical protein